MSIEYIVPGLSLAVAAIVWLVRLEGRISVGASRTDSVEKRVDGLEERIYSQLDRIETRLLALRQSKD